MIRRLSILAAMLSVFFSAGAKADCLPMDLTRDTLAPGVVRTAFGENTSYEYVDTATEQRLLDTLRELYEGSENVAIAHIDSVFPVDAGHTGWGDDSVVIKVDTVLKGTVTFQTLRFRHEKWEDSGDFGQLIDSQFLAFLGDDSIPQFLGLGTPSICTENWDNGGATGFYVSNGLIAHKGYGAMLGVAVPMSEFLSTSAVHTPLTPAHNDAIKRYRVALGERGDGRTGFSVLGRTVTYRLNGMLLRIIEKRK